MPEAPMSPRAARALPVDAVLFDLDGTLADTAPDLAAALNRVRRARGLVPVPASRPPRTAKNLRANSRARGPEIRTTPTPPSPGGVARATMVSE